MNRVIWPSARPRPEAKSEEVRELPVWTMVKESYDADLPAEDRELHRR